MSNSQSNETGNGGASGGSPTCFVLCKLPTGLVIESGYTFPKNGIGIARLPNYKRVMLAGANKRILELARQSGPNQVPTSPKNMHAGITANVDEAFFDKWVHDHKDSNIVKLWTTSNGLREWKHARKCKKRVSLSLSVLTPWTPEARRKSHEHSSVYVDANSNRDRSIRPGGFSYGVPGIYRAHRRTDSHVL